MATITEKLSEKRRKYWKALVEHTNQKMEEYLIQYQQDEEFVSEYYNVKLVVKYDADVEFGLKIHFKINDELCDFYDGFSVEFFKSDKSVRQYLDFLNLQLSDMPDEECTVIMLHSDFSIEEMKDNEEVCILELELRLEVD